MNEPSSIVGNLLSGWRERSYGSTFAGARSSIPATPSTRGHVRSSGDDVPRTEVPPPSRGLSNSSRNILADTRQPQGGRLVGPNVDGGREDASIGRARRRMNFWKATTPSQEMLLISAGIAVLAFHWGDDDMRCHSDIMDDSMLNSCVRWWTLAVVMLKTLSLITSVCASRWEKREDLGEATAGGLLRILYLGVFLNALHILAFAYYGVMMLFVNTSCGWGSPIFQLNVVFMIVFFTPMVAAVRLTMDVFVLFVMLVLIILLWLPVRALLQRFCPSFLPGELLQRLPWARGRQGAVEDSEEVPLQGEVSSDYQNSHEHCDGRDVHAGRPASHEPSFSSMEIDTSTAEQGLARHSPV